LLTHLKEITSAFDKGPNIKERQFKHLFYFSLPRSAAFWMNLFKTSGCGTPIKSSKKKIRFPQ